MGLASVLILLALAGGLAACSGGYDVTRGPGYYGDQEPETVEEARRVDGRAGAGKSAPAAGSPTH